MQRDVVTACARKPATASRSDHAVPCCSGLCLRAAEQPTTQASRATSEGMSVGQRPSCKAGHAHTEKCFYAA